MTKGIGWYNRSFCLGLGAGLLLCALAGGAGLHYLRQHGLQVELSTATLTGTLQSRIQAQTKTDLMKAIAGVEKEIPDRVKTQLAGLAAPAKLQFAGLTIELPASVTQDLEAHLAATVEDSIIAILRQIDTDALAARMGREVTKGIQQSLQRDLGRKIMIKPVPGLAVPVTVEFGE